MRRKLCIFSIIVFILITSASVVDQLTPFVTTNHTPLDIANMDLSIMSEDLEDCAVILSGAEFHGTTATYDLQYALTTALHQQAGVRYLLLGIGHATAQIYNLYLESGNHEFLDMVMSEIRYSSSSSFEHRQSWERLLEYNQGLPAEERLTVVGIDLEYQPYTAIRYMNFLTGTQSLVPQPEAYLGTPAALDSYVQTLRQDFETRQEEYRTALGENYAEFIIVLDNLTDTVAANFDDDFYDFREQILYANFLRAYELNPGKYFGQFTMEHVYQNQAGTSNMEGLDRLAMYLNRDDSPVEGQVISIAAMYVDSVFRFYYGRYYNSDIIQDYYTDGLIFRTVSEADYTLFRLTGKSSPFNRGTFTVRRPYGGVTTDYYQYLLVIKNSKPTSANKS